MRFLIKLASVAMVILASNGILPLIRDGGAREQGLLMPSQQSNVLLDILPRIWGGGVLLLVAGVVLTTRLKRSQFKPDVLLGLVVLSCLTSALWASFPNETLRTAILLMCSYFLVHVHTRLVGVEEALLLVERVLIAINVSSVTLIVFAPAYGISVGEHSGSWQGVFDHKNGLGNFAAVSFVISAWAVRHRRSVLSGFSCVLAVLLVIGSQSNTALISLIAAVFLLILFQSRRVLKLISPLRYALFSAVLGLLVAQLILSLQFPDAPLLLGSGDATFTGRTLIWAVTVEQGMAEPILGHGVGQFSRFGFSDSNEALGKLGIIVGSAHNGFLELFFALGLYGVLLVILLLVDTVKRARTPYLVAMLFPFLVVFLMLNFTESRLLGFNLFFVLMMYIRQVVRHHSEGADFSRARMRDTPQSL